MMDAELLLSKLCTWWTVRVEILIQNSQGTENSPNSPFCNEFKLLCMLGSPLSCRRSFRFLVKLKFPDGTWPFICAADIVIVVLLRLLLLLELLLLLPVRILGCCLGAGGL